MVQASTHILPPTQDRLGLRPWATPNQDWSLFCSFETAYVLHTNVNFSLKVLFALWVVVVLQDSSRDFPLCGLDNQWWQRVLWSSAAAFVVAVFSDVFWTHILGPTFGEKPCIFSSTVFSVSGIIPSILLLKLFHKLLSAKMYLSCQADVKYWASTEDTRHNSLG